MQIRGLIIPESIYNNERTIIDESAKVIAVPQVESLSLSLENFQRIKNPSIKKFRLSEGLHRYQSPLLTVTCRKLYFIKFEPRENTPRHATVQKQLLARNDLSMENG